MNNYEVITNMTPEVLSDFLVHNHDCPECCGGTCSTCEYKDKENMLKWLNEAPQEWYYKMILGYKIEV